MVLTDLQCLHPHYIHLILLNYVNIIFTSHSVALVDNRHSRVAVYSPIKEEKKNFSQLNQCVPNPQNIQMIYAITNKFYSISNWQVK